MIFIGDVHGKYKQYKRILKESSAPTIQVGDMGVGFRRIQGWRAGEYIENPPHAWMLKGNHRFIRGNHDNPKVCRHHSQCIPDGHVENGIMFIGGAVSIDQAWRVKDYSWWEDEELSELELSDLIDKYVMIKPDVMVTHECPENVANAMITHLGRTKFDWPSRTRRAFEMMFSAHSPKLWVFGHWHFSFDGIMNGTRFVCLNELEVRDLEV